MSSKSGKIQLSDIKVGKTFYLVRADFPIIMPGVVGNGEVEGIVRLRVTSRPFLRRLSYTQAFTFVTDTGQESWINLDALWPNHACAEITREAPYFVVLKNHRAVQRFLKTFEDRPPSEAEKCRTLLREAGLNAKQRGLT